MREDICKQVTSLQGLAFHALKKIISWRRDFEIDQPNIDSQHEGIFKLALEASELSRRPQDNGKLLGIFEKFGSVLDAHFRYEERMLAEIAYPKLEEHRAEHKAMLSELAFIRQRLSSQGEGWVFQQKALVVLNFMLGVTVGHILLSDVDYAQFIQQGAKTGD